MRVYCTLLSLCALTFLLTSGATIDKSKIVKETKEPSAKKDEEIKNKIAVTKNADVDANVVSASPTSSDVATNSAVDFVSGEDVANFSGKSQNQIFNQIVPFANVKDFYGK